MGTKNNPGTFDCYEAAGMDEPMFNLLARDEQSPERVRDWVKKRTQRFYHELQAGMSEEDMLRVNRKIAEAVRCADAMEVWRANELDRERQQEESRRLHLLPLPPRRGVVKVDGKLREHNGRSLGKVVDRFHNPQPGDRNTVEVPRSRTCCGFAPSCQDTRCQYMRFAQGLPDNVTPAEAAERRADVERPDERTLPRDHEAG